MKFEFNTPTYIYIQTSGHLKFYTCLTQFVLNTKILGDIDFSLALLVITTSNESEKFSFCICVHDIVFNASSHHITNHFHKTLIFSHIIWGQGGGGYIMQQYMHGLWNLDHA